MSPAPMRNGDKSQNRYSISLALNRLLILLGLTGVAISEPLLTIFGADIGLFYFYNITQLESAVLYALIVTFFPVIILWGGVTLLQCVNHRLATVAYLCVLAGLAFFWSMQLGRWTLDLGGQGILISFSVFGAGLFLVLYQCVPSLHFILKIMAITPLAALFLFVFYSDVSGLQNPGSPEIIGFSTAGKSVNQKDTPSVLFIILDEFPTLGLLNEQNSIDAKRFPNIAKLASQATWYRNYSVQSDWTLYSVPAILSGGEPAQKKPNFGNYPRNLFSLLAPTHHLTAYETLTKLCGLSKCSMGPPGASTTQDAPRFEALFHKTRNIWLQRVSLAKLETSAMADFEEIWESEPDPTAGLNLDLVKFEHGSFSTNAMVKQPKRVTRFVESISNAGPALYYLHLMLPHTPWKFYRNGELYELPETRPPFSENNDDGGEWLSRFTEYRFLLQAQYADTVLGQIFEKMKSSGLWEESLVIVTADHGRSFLPGTTGRYVSGGSIASIAYAPLFIKLPQQQQGGIDDSNLMSTDLLPTLANSLGMELPWASVGYPAGHRAIEERGDKKIFFPIVRGENRAHKDLGEMKVYSSSDHQPDYGLRGVTAADAATDLIATLNDSLGLKKYIGRSPGEFTIDFGGTVVVDELDRLRAPPEGKPLLGAIVGNLGFQSNMGTVIIAVNDVFVTGAPLVTFKGVENSFIAALPQGLLQKKNRIAVYLVKGENLIALDAQVE